MKRPVLILVGAVVLGTGAFFYERFGRPPSAAELAALRREHQTLSEELARRLGSEADPPASAAASVVVGIPIPFAQRFAQDAAARLLQDMTLTLRGVKVEKTGELKAGLLGQLGRFTLHLELEEVRALLRAEKPSLGASAAHLNVTVPLRVAKGTGRGRLQLQWNGAGVAGGVCGDFAMTGPIAGNVVPAVYKLRARVALATEGATLVAMPQLEDVVVPLHVEPSAETWRLLDDAIAARPALCRTALDAANVREKIRALVARGFGVKLPRRLLPRLALPVEMERAIAMEGGPMHVQVKPVEVTVARQRVWYRADVRVLEKENAAPGDEPDAAVEPEPGPAPLEGEADAETETLVVVPAVEEHLEVRPEPDHH